MGSYDKIINLPHHTSKNHPRMSMYQRAAQFAPFAALTGHGAAISETARLTDSEIELSDQERRILDDKLAQLIQHIKERPSVSITHFVPDQQKEGGRYSVHSGTVSKWDEYEHKLIFTDGMTINTNTVIDIDGPLFTPQGTKE